MCLVGVKVRLIRGFVIQVNFSNEEGLSAFMKRVLPRAAMEDSGGSASGGGDHQYF